MNEIKILLKFKCKISKQFPGQNYIKFLVDTLDKWAIFLLTF